MSDKFRNTFPIAVNFSDGELPDSKKMNGLASQAKTSASVLEHAIGDVWNQSGDALVQQTSLTAEALMIPNLARYIGSTRYTSPRVPYLPDLDLVDHVFNNNGEHWETLVLPVSSTGTTWTWAGTGAPSGGPETNLSDVNASGEWWVDRDTGRAFFYDPINATDWTLTYEPVCEGDHGSDTSFNIIPDMSTDPTYQYQSLKLEYVNGTDSTDGYFIYLPPRGPLTRTHGRSPRDDDNIGNPVNFQSGALGSTPRKFWQDDVSAGDTSANAYHYRYSVPKIISDNWSQAGSLSQGLLYLWDPTYTGTIIEGLSFFAENASTPRTWILKVTGANLDTWLSNYGSSLYPATNLQSASHVSTLYPVNGLRLITVGAPLSEIVDELNRKMITHDHGSANSLPGAVVSHGNLTDLFDPVMTFTSARLVPSKLDNDDHPQYLHRGGSDIITGRDDLNNSMLGSLLMASTSSGTNWSNLDADSKAIIFGEYPLGPQTFFDYQDYENKPVLQTFLPASTSGVQMGGVHEIHRGIDHRITVASNPSGLGEAIADLEFAEFLLGPDNSSVTAGMKIIRTDSAPVHRIDIGRLDGGQSICQITDQTANGGIYINSSTGSYTYATRESWIKPALTPINEGVQDGAVSGDPWYKSWDFETGNINWYHEADSGLSPSDFQFGFIIRDFPHNCNLSAIDIIWELEDVAGSTTVNTGIGVSLFRLRRYPDDLGDAVNYSSTQILNLSNQKTTKTKTQQKYLYTDGDWSGGLTNLLRDRDHLYIRFTPAAHTSGGGNILATRIYDVAIRIQHNNAAPFDTTAT